MHAEKAVNCDGTKHCLPQLQSTHADCAKSSGVNYFQGSWELISEKNLQFSRSSTQGLSYTEIGYQGFYCISAMKIQTSSWEKNQQLDLASEATDCHLHS